MLECQVQNLRLGPKWLQNCWNSTFILPQTVPRCKIPNVKVYDDGKSIPWQFMQLCKFKELVNFFAKEGRVYRMLLMNEAPMTGHIKLKHWLERKSFRMFGKIKDWDWVSFLYCLKEYLTFKYKENWEQKMNRSSGSIDEF